MGFLTSIGASTTDAGTTATPSSPPSGGFLAAIGAGAPSPSAPATGFLSKVGATPSSASDPSLPASASNPLPTAAEYALPAGPSKPSPTPAYDFASGKLLNPSNFQPSAPAPVTSDTIGESIGQEKADAATLSPALAESSIQIPAGLKVGDEFDYKGQKYTVSGPSFNDVMNHISLADWDKENNPSMKKAVPVMSGSTEQELAPGEDEEMLNPSRIASLGARETYRLGRSVLGQVLNVAIAFGYMGNNLASAVSPATDSGREQLPQVPELSFEPGEEPLKLASSLISSGAEFMAGGELMEPFMEALKGASFVPRVIGKALLNTALPALIEQIPPLQPGETRAGRAWMGLPNDLTWGLFSIMPGKMLSTIGLGLAQYGESKYVGQDQTGSITGAAIAMLFNLIGHTEETKESYEPLGFAGFKSRATRLAGADLGENPDPMDLATKRAAVEFNKLSNEDKRAFYAQSKGSLDYIAQAGAKREAEIKESMKGADDRMSGKTSTEDLPQPPAHVAEAMERAGNGVQPDAGEEEKAAAQDSSFKSAEELGGRYSLANSNLAMKKEGGIWRIVGPDNQPIKGMSTATTREIHTAQEAYEKAKGTGAGKAKAANDVVKAAVDKGIRESDSGHLATVEDGSGKTMRKTASSAAVDLAMRLQKGGTELTEAQIEQVEKDPRQFLKDNAITASMRGSLSDEEKAAEEKRRKKQSPGQTVKDRFGGAESGTVFNPDQKQLAEMRRAGTVEYKRASGIARFRADENPPEASSAYEGEDDLTTKVLTRLEGKASVSKQFISDLTNAADLKQPERDLIRKTLAEYPDGKDVPVAAFANAVKTELLPLEQNRGGNDYENINLPEEQRGDVENYSSNVYQSPIKTSAGEIHFGDVRNGDSANLPLDRYFAHTRTEDLPPDAVMGDIKKGKTVSDAYDNSGGEPGTTRRILELQSDLFQKGRLEREQPRGEDEYPTNTKEAQKLRQREARRDELAKLEPYRNTWQDRIVREEVKQAAKDGKTTLLFPTGETAMKIEGLGSREMWGIRETKGFEAPVRSLKDVDLKVGQEIFDQIGHGVENSFIITDVLGDGKFKAVPKNAIPRNFEYMPNGKTRFEANGGQVYLKDGKYTQLDWIKEHQGNYAEQFDISGKVDTTNPIYKFYEKEVARYLKNRYSATPFTDDKGVTWNKVEIKPEHAEEPVEAFKRGSGSGFKRDPEEIRKIIHEIIPEKDISLVFRKNLIDGIATGRYSRENTDILNPTVKPLIELYEKGGKVSALDAFHEAGHYLFDNYVSGPEKRAMLDKAREEMGAIKKASYRFAGYKGSDKIAEEYIMDEYAKQKAAEAGFKGPLKSALETIHSIMKNIYGIYEKARDYISSIPNRQGGFARFAGTDTDSMESEDRAKMDEFAAHAEKYVSENMDDLKANYASKYGNVFSVDKFKSLIEGHDENPTYSEAFHAPVARAIGAMINERLSEKGNGRTAVFMAGATASGKSTILDGARSENDGDIVIDGTLASYRAMDQIKKALSNDWKVALKYVYNTPENIFDNLVKRAVEGGRTVPIETAYNSLLQSLQHTVRMAGKYGDNPNLLLDIYDNSSGTTEAVENGLDFLKSKGYSKDDIARFKEEAYQKATQLYDQGKISKEIYEGLTRRKPDVPGSGDASEQGFAGESEEESPGRKEDTVTARPDEAAETPTKASQASFNDAANDIIESPSYEHIDNMPINKETMERSDALEKKAQKLEIRKEVLDQNPAKNLAKYANKRTGELPTVTGGPEAKTEFAKRGDDIVTELGFDTPEKANEALGKYLSDKSAFNEEVKAYLEEKKTLLQQFKSDAEKYGSPTQHEPGDYDFEITENNKGVVPPEVRGGIQSPELDFSKWKDRATIRLGRDTMERNLEKVATPADAEKAKAFLVDPVRQNELDRVNFNNDLRSTIRGKMKELGLKRGTAADEAVQVFGEGKMNKDVLIKEFPKKYAQIEAAADYFRKLYDDLLNRWNEERVKYGYRPVAKRADYFRHFADINQFTNQFGFLRSDSQLPTEIAGISSTFRPGKPFSTAEIRRVGNLTSYSAIGGMDNYLDSMSKQMFHIDSLQRGRAMEKYIREVAKQNPHLKLSNFVQNLTEWSNLTSGKAHSLDRSIEGTVGRPVMKFLSGVSNLIARNIIVGNISVAMTHLVSLPLNLATVDKVPFLRGMLSTLASPLRSEPFDTIDGIQSSFLARRFPEKSIMPTKWDKVQDTMSFLFTAADKFKSRLAVESKYQEGLAEGLPKEDAMKAADEYAGRIAGDYSIGNRPNLLAAHATKLIAQFQLGVNDGLSVLMHDIPHWEDGNKAQIARRLVEFSVYSWAFNQLYKQIRGAGKGLDPIDTGLTLMGLNEEGKGQDFLTRLSLAGKDLAGELPFTSIVTGTFPLATAIQQPIKDMQQGDYLKTLLDAGLEFSPTGGTTQAMKTYEGIKAWEEGQTTTQSGNIGNTVEKTPSNFVKGAIFGPTAFSDAASQKQETTNLIGLLNDRSSSVAKTAENEYAQMKAMSPADADTAFNALAKSNPDLARRVKTIADQDRLGVTQNERLIKQLNVSEGVRAQYIYNKLMQLPDDASRTQLWNEYTQKKIITPAVAKQISDLVANKAPSGAPVSASSQPAGNSLQPGTYDRQSFLTHLLNTAKALGTDPVKAFDEMYNGEKIVSVQNGAILVERMSDDKSNAIRAEKGALPKTQQLDHIIPLEAGGDNQPDNLEIIPTSANQGQEQHALEDFLGTQVRSGAMKESQARELAIRWKAGQGFPLSPAYLDEYNTKYGGKPLTTQDVYNYKNLNL